MHCGRSIVSLAMYEKGYLCRKDPSHPPPPRKSTQLACIYTEYVYVATLIQKGCPLWSEYIARVNFHYKLYEFHFGTENMLPKAILREVGDME